jgi:hypothetical protein
MIQPGDYVVYTENKVKIITDVYSGIMGNNDRLYNNISNKIFIVTAINGEFIDVLTSKQEHKNLYTSQFKKATEGQIKKHQLENLFKK